MATIELPRKLLNPLEQLATRQGSSVEALLEDVVTDYLHEQRHEQLLQEMERFRDQHSQLMVQYAGQFVGMLDGRVLDHDADAGVLYKRLRLQYGDAPILIVEVKDTPEQEFTRFHRRIVT
ncbi:MAG TPA: hypothetical protein PLD25_30770 [Chloroflexota bacterium]|nr:hypothetical protein [Chloroflexota bacterium]HUM68675.1 hypothetical protein [Chloroflexota bacterium]